MTAEPARTRVRLSAGDRRGQLIGIGLRLLVSRPIHELSVHEVAAEAGVSRGLLFHYFPTKRDYYVAVVRAAGQLLLRHTRLPGEGRPEERVRAVVGGLVGFVRRRRAVHVALVRAGAGGDELVAEVFEDVRATLAERVLTALGESSPDPLVRLAVRGWLAMAEEMAIEAGQEPAAEELVDFLVDGLGRLLAPLSAPLAPPR